MTVESPFLLVVNLVKGEGSGKMGGGRERKLTKKGREEYSLAGQTLESLPSLGGGREMSTLL